MVELGIAHDFCRSSYLPLGSRLATGLACDERSRSFCAASVEKSQKNLRTCVYSRYAGWDIKAMAAF